MQAAAARARRLLASAAASGIQGALSASHRAGAAGAELVLLPHLDNGFPASPSSPHHARSFSSHLPREFSCPDSVYLLVATSTRCSANWLMRHFVELVLGTRGGDAN